MSGCGRQFESQCRHRQVASSIRFITNWRKRKMATQLCQKCKQAHPGRVCDYDEKGECAETISVNEVAQTGTSHQKARKMKAGAVNPAKTNRTPRRVGAPQTG